MENLPIGFEANGPASDEQIRAVMNALDFQLPLDYIEFIKLYNGGEGEIGQNSWLVLFPLKDLIDFNKANNLLMEQIPNYFLIGKDAADTGYAFHKQTGAVYSFGMMSDFETDTIIECGINFNDFLLKLYQQ